mgnify:CR=1 FL=1
MTTSTVSAASSWGEDGASSASFLSEKRGKKGGAFSSALVRLSVMIALPTEQRLGRQKWDACQLAGYDGGQLSREPAHRAHMPSTNLIAPRPCLVLAGGSLRASVRRNTCT